MVWILFSWLESSPYSVAESKERVIWSPNVPTFTREVIPEVNIKPLNASKHSTGVGIIRHLIIHLQLRG